MYFLSHALKVVQHFEEWYNVMAPTCPNESHEACSKYLTSICGMTMAENVMLKINTLFV